MPFRRKHAGLPSVPGLTPTGPPALVAGSFLALLSLWLCRLGRAVGLARVAGHLGRAEADTGRDGRWVGGSQQPGQGRDAEDGEADHRPDLDRPFPVDRETPEAPAHVNPRDRAAKLSPRTVRKLGKTGLSGLRFGRKSEPSHPAIAYGTAKLGR
jgi:hypothetical protein